MQKITAILFAEIIEAVVVPMTTTYAQQPNTTIASCLDIVTLIYLDSLNATLNVTEIAPNSTTLLENVNNYLPT